MTAAASLAIALLMAAPSHACPDARTCVAAAAEAYRAGRFAEALDLFKEAQIDGPDPTIAWNIANLLAELGRGREAIAAFDAFVEAHPNDPRVVIAGRKRALVEANSHPQDVQVEVHAPPGASVRIAEHRGQAPFTATVPTDGPVQILIEGGASPTAGPDLTLPGWLAIGAGAAAGVGAAVVLAYAADESDRADALSLRALSDREHQVEDEDDRVGIRDIHAAQDASQRGHTAGLILGGVAIAAVTAGGLLLALDTLSAADEPTFIVGPTSAAVGWHF